MQRRSTMTVLALVFGAAAVAGAFAQSAHGTDPALMEVSAQSLAFSEVNVPGFDPGMKLAVVHGNPEAAGAYTVRLSFPAGYKFPPHWHPNAENLTVLSGTFRLAMGEKADPSQLKTYKAGDFLYIPGKHPHFGGVEGPTVIQLHGEGPFTINLVKGTSE
jgi:quercetin dioxygenase-like cupin family protein